MKALVQRVSEASVTIDGLIHSRITKGLVVLLGVDIKDSTEDADWLCQKLIGLRIFSDENGLMNQSIIDVQGELLLVSQFTLIASYKKGNRPSFIHAARPEQAIPLYEQMIQKLSNVLGAPIQTGVFGADMQVSLCNDGPVTIIIDSKNP